ncbi:hypothetical protein D3C85_1779250 [compost metagenome]
MMRPTIINLRRPISLVISLEIRLYIVTTARQFKKQVFQRRQSAIHFQNADSTLDQTFVPLSNFIF